MESFRLMCNDAIRIGLAADASSLKRLSKLTYGELKRYDDVPSYYKLCAISKAAGSSRQGKSQSSADFTRGIHTSQSLCSFPAMGSSLRMARFSSLLATTDLRRYRSMATRRQPYRSQAWYCGLS